MVTETGLLDKFDFPFMVNLSCSLILVSRVTQELYRSQCYLGSKQKASLERRWKELPSVFSFRLF